MVSAKAVQCSEQLLSGLRGYWSVRRYKIVLSGSINLSWPNIEPIFTLLCRLVFISRLRLTANNRLDAAP